ncbi:MAG: alpha-hydroxy acid oxidase [Burkholderiaceae bacterium]
MLALQDFEALARARLPRALFGYVAGAAETNLSLRDNLQAFEQWGLVPRVLRDVSRRTQTIPLFGREHASPFGIAPMGIAALTAYEGDAVLARSAERAGIPFILSGSSLMPMEELLRQAPGSWFQAYLPGDLKRIDALLDRVQSAGVHTLVITVDIPVAGNRENNMRAGFSTPLRPSLRLAWDGITHPRWLIGTLMRTLTHHGMPHFENSFAQRGAPLIARDVERDFSNREHLDWDHVTHIRRRWPGELVIKGVLSVDDACIAQGLGVDGLIVSNHGGRQLDGAVSALRVLPHIVRAVPSMPVMLDGGVRRGSDVLKAIALGARLVFVGRPFNYAAAVAGDAGVARAIELLRDEVDRDLAMLGVNAPTELDMSFLHSLVQAFPHSNHC